MSTDSSSNTVTPVKRRKYLPTGSLSTPTSAAYSSADAQTSSPDIALHPISSFSAPTAGPSTVTVHETRSKKLKRPASSNSLSQAPDDDDDIEEIAEGTPVKGKGKKKAKHRIFVVLNASDCPPS
ncbi:hypothetical protein B0H14DRAFT_2626174 [Mycena olivaceomarginata]|nr:hypothetical protein B0H14DRAFT_2626174 [Mycena olivaceomarginata]